MFRMSIRSCQVVRFLFNIKSMQMNNCFFLLGKMSCLINRRIHTRSTKGPALIQPKLDLIKDEPLIGLRYLVEYVADIHIQREPIYVCKICETKLDSRNLIDHMIGLRHRMQFMVRLIWTDFF